MQSKLRGKERDMEGERWENREEWREGGRQRGEGRMKRGMRIELNRIVRGG